MDNRTILIRAWSPVPLRRPDLAGVYALDYDALFYIHDRLEAELPGYEVEVRLHAMAGMYAPQLEELLWFFDIQVPWDELAGSGARVIGEVLRGVFREYFDRRRSQKIEAEPPNEKQEHEPTPEEAAERVPIYGPRGQILVRVRPNAPAKESDKG